MALYRKVSPVLWDDELIVDADDFTRTVWFALLTGPQVTNLPGLMTATAAGIADVLRRDPATVKACMVKLVAMGRIQIDDRLRIVRIPRAPKHNEPENVNVLKGWWNTWKALPESALKRRHVTSLRAGFDLARARWAHDPKKSGDWDVAWANSFGAVPAEPEAPPETVSIPVPNRIETVSEPIGDGIETVSKPSDIQEQEQEQFQEQEQDPSGGRTAIAGPPSLGVGPVAETGERESAAGPPSSPGAPDKTSPCAASPVQPPLLSLVPPKPPKVIVGPKPEKPDAVAWRVWREVYKASRRGYGKYVSAPADGPIMGKLGKHAVSVADELEHPGEAEHLLRWWFRAYLRDEGDKGFSLKDHKHGLQWFERGIPTYGAPWGQAVRPKLTEKRPEDLPARTAKIIQLPQDPDAKIDIPKNFLAAIAGVGRGVPTEGPTAEQLDQRRARNQEQAAALLAEERPAQ